MPVLIKQKLKLPKRAALLERFCTFLILLLLSFSSAQTPTTIVAVGDLSCSPNDPNYNEGKGTQDACQMQAVADLIRTLEPTALLLLGDLQYQDGLLSDFMSSYDRFFSEFNPIAFPVLGNHEYYSGGGGFFEYFGDRVPSDEGYYAFRLGEWRLLALNSNCGRVGGCVRGSAQYDWLERELQVSSVCSLAFFHHPMISSGPHGGHRELFDFFELLDERSVELTLSGHEHFYERFSPISGQRIDDEAGVQPFVVGTGGKSHYGFNFFPTRFSKKRIGNVFGVLKLDLFEDHYVWAFMNTDNEIMDSGRRDCH